MMNDIVSCGYRMSIPCSPKQQLVIFMRINYNKIKSFTERNGGSFPQAMYKRFLATLYTYPKIRNLMVRFYSIRKPKKWVFLVGCYNSGTTIFRDILGIHPEIAVLPREGVRFTSLLPRPEEKGWKRMWIGCPEHMSMPKSNHKKIADRIIMDWSPWWNTDATVFLEKSITNITRMKWLDDNFENAYFIGITRDAYPVVEGIKRRASPEGDARKQLGSDQYPLELIGQQWVDANSRLLQDSNKVNRYFSIKYEELVTDPLSILNELWGFLEIKHIESSYNDNILTVADRQLSLKNMNEISISRLSAEDIMKITPVIQNMQTLLGYQVIHMTPHDQLNDE